jgi:hypothetical protein
MAAIVAAAMLLTLQSTAVAEDRIRLSMGTDGEAAKYESGTW